MFYNLNRYFTNNFQIWCAYVCINFKIQPWPSAMRSMEATKRTKFECWAHFISVLKFRSKFHGWSWNTRPSELQRTQIASISLTLQDWPILLKYSTHKVSKGLSMQHTMQNTTYYKIMAILNFWQKVWKLKIPSISLTA